MPFTIPSKVQTLHASISSTVALISSTVASITSSMLPPSKMTSVFVPPREKATETPKTNVLQEDEYGKPKWASVRDEPRPVIVAEPSHAITDGNLETDDRYSDDQGDIARAATSIANVSSPA
jgi:hypothetical protein